MILIADSGSTKTDWCVVEEGKALRRVVTSGINPFFQTADEIARMLEADLLPPLSGLFPVAVHFYGAGCLPERAEEVRRAIGRCLPMADRVEVNTDMLAAARGLCGHRAGIACIMGTGSNSCYYDGRRIVSNVPPLGFILGDEGSGAVLGKLLVADVLKNRLPSALKAEFLSQFNLTQEEIIDRVYRRPFPNRFLASLSPFLAQHLHEPLLKALVLDSFRAFLRRNVLQYDCTGHEVHFTGSVAFHYRHVLEEAVCAEGLRLGRVLKSPMEGLVQYHAG